MAEGSNASSGRILVVDDDMELCQVIVDTLKDNGYDANFVQTAEEAHERINANHPDLVLLDLEIPAMGGFVLCQKIRSNPYTKDVPVVFLTVRDSHFDRQTALSLGANQYITKPFRRSFLLKEVATILAAHKEDLIGPSQAHLEKNASAPAPVGAPSARQTVPGAVPQAGPAELTPEAINAGITATGKNVVDSPAQEIAAAKSEPDKPYSAAKKDGQAVPAAPKASKLAKILAMPQVIKLKVWILGHKAIAIGVAFVVMSGAMWGSVNLYRKITAVTKEKKEEKGDQSPISVNVMQAVPAPFQDILTAVGTIAGGAEIELRFQTEGKVSVLRVKEGDAVRAGQLIAQLDQTQSSMKLERARSEYYRYEKLYALGGVSKDRLDEARVQMDYAQSELEKTVMRASQDGIFGDRGIEVGEFVTPQKKIGTLVSLNSVLVRVGVIEKEIDKIYPGQKVTANVDTYPGVEFKGKVENISPLIQGQSKTLTVEARLPNEGKLLLPGMFARTRIVVFEKDSVISVPNDALEKGQNGYKIYVVTKDNKAQARPVEIGYASLSHSVIAKGIEPGDLIIIEKPQDLKDGSPVKVIEAEKAGSGESQAAGGEPSSEQGAQPGEQPGGQQPQ